MGGNDPHRHDGFDRFFNGHVRREYLVLWEKEEEPLGRDKCRGNKNGHLHPLFEIGQLIGHEPEDKIPLLWELNEDSLAKGSLSGGGEGIGQLFRREIDILHDGDICKQAVCPTDQLPTQNIGGDDPDEIEQKEEADDPQPRKVIISVEKIDGHLWHQWAEDAIQGVEDEL